MICPWPRCGRPVVKYHAAGIRVAMCIGHWGVLVAFLRALPDRRER